MTQAELEGELEAMGAVDPKRQAETMRDHLMVTVIMGQFKQDKEGNLMESKDEKEKVEELSPTLRGIDISILGDREDIAKFEDQAFLEMPDFLVEHDVDGPFLKVVTERAHYKIRLTWPSMKP